MSEFTYRGMPLPADFDPRAWRDGDPDYDAVITGWANYLQGVDAALETRAPEAKPAGSVEALRAELEALCESEDWHGAVDADDIRVILDRSVTATAPVKDTYTELTDGEGDVWFELPGHLAGRYALWTSWETRKEAGEFFATRPGIASTYEEVQEYGGIIAERERTGDTR